MRHKYAHIKDMAQLNNELELSLIRRQVLLNEINANIDDVRANFSLGGTVLSGIGSLFSFGPRAVKSQGIDKLESVLKIATKIGGIIALIRTFKRSR